jgi:hypothetical protein
MLLLAEKPLISHYSAAACSMMQQQPLA